MITIVRCPNIWSARISSVPHILSKNINRNINTWITKMAELLKNGVTILVFLTGVDFRTSHIHFSIICNILCIIVYHWLRKWSEQITLSNRSGKFWLMHKTFKHGWALKYCMASQTNILKSPTKRHKEKTCKTFHLY